MIDERKRKGSKLLVSRIEAEGGLLGGTFRPGLGFAKVAVAVVCREAHTDGLGDAEFFHRHAIHHVGAGHGALGVGDDDEL